MAINALFWAALIAPIVAYPILSECFSQSYFARLLASIFWVFLILQACVGMALLLRIFLRFESSNVGVLGAIGLSLFIYAGSMLNLLHLANRGVIQFAVYFFALFFIACIAFKVLKFGKRSEQFSRKLSVALLLAVLLLILNCVLVAMNTGFNIHDDYQGYLVFPTKLLEMGYMGPDPFSERRVVTGLGGGPFLLALGLAGMSWNFIHVLDIGLGLALVFLIVIFFQSDSNKNSWIAKVILLFGVACLQAPGANLTSTFIPSALALGALVFFVEDGRGFNSIKRFDYREIIILALLISGLIALKNTFIVYAALIVISAAMFKYAPMNTGLLRNFIFLVRFSGILFLLLLPWMWELYSATGTFFYPLFGKGVHASAYGNFPAATDGFLVGSNFWIDIQKIIDPYRRTIVLLNISLLVILLFNSRISVNKIRLQYFVFLVVCCCLVNILCVGFLIGGYGAYRYIFFSAIASFVFGFLLLLKSSLDQRIQKTLFLVALIFSVNAFVKFIPAAKDIWLQKQFLLGAPISSERYLSYESLSHSLPLSGKILTRLDLPFLLAYSRSNIYIADYPGSASPPPGMPFKQGPEKLVKYLQDQNIDYLVWDYGWKANFSIETYGDRLGKSTHPWIRSEAEHAFDFQLNLEYLRKTMPVIYDANGFAIIDIRNQ